MGGDGFNVLSKGTVLASTNDTDLNTLIEYIKSLPQPFSGLIEGRIKQVI